MQCMNQQLKMYYSTDFGCNFKLDDNSRLMSSVGDVWKYVNVDDFDMPETFILNNIIQTLQGDFQ